ncbi:MAG: hypothetical protein V1644_01150, partial [Candidatus Micrarchaeota archaeon]
MQSPTLTMRQFEVESRKAQRLFSGQKTRSGISTFERNKQLVQTLHQFSHDLPREVVLAGLYYQLPREHLGKLQPAVRRMVQQANGLSGEVTNPARYAEVLTRGNIRPPAFLINLASVLVALRDNRVPPELKSKLGRIAVDVHSQLAESMGLHWIQHEVGNLGVKHGYPAQYVKIVRILTDGEAKFERHVLPKLRENVRAAAEGLGIHYEFSYRPKQPYSAFIRWKRKTSGRKQPSKLHFSDSAATRVVLHGVDADCFKFLQNLKKQPGIKVKVEDDYINNQKPNGYKSLHLLVRRKGRKDWFELQVRTHEMHVAAEAENPAQLHYVYKLGHFPPEAIKEIRKI